jgi:cation:H+ antiporter
MVWLQFVLSAAVIVVAAVKLAEYGDAIAYRTRLGGMFVGTLLVAGATSLPELLTVLNAIQQGHANLTAGDLFGSGMFNMLVLGMLGLVFPKERLLRRVATRHALAASLAVLLIGMAVFFLIVDIDLRIGWVGIDSLLLIATYVGGVGLIRGNTGDRQVEETTEEDLSTLPSLRRAAIGFVIAALVLALTTPWLVRSASQIAEITGLGTGFVGLLLVAVVTSLPELVATWTAVRVGAYDMAVGNLFGSNIFNMFALGIADLVYTRGRFLGAISPVFALAGMLALLLTTLGLVGNLARLRRRLWIVEIDALLLLLVYLGGMWLLYRRGVGS